MDDYAFTNPHSDLVALHGGPRDHRWFYYRDWIAARRASRRLRCPLERPDGASRCYAPTTDVTHQQGKGNTELTVRAWAYVPPVQWRAWGHEYRTPEEHHDPYETAAPQGDVTSTPRSLWGAADHFGQHM